MSIAPALFTSQTDEWSTPADLFAKINRRFGPLELDVCATADNAKCARFFTREQDGLHQPWQGRCWCNPPYGRGIGQWVKKALESAQAGATVVCLLPARTDTTWWQDVVVPFGQVEFLRGRVRFGGSQNGAPFPSAIVVFRPTPLVTCEQCGRDFPPRRSDARFCCLGCKQAAYRERRTAAVVTALSVTEGNGR